MKYLSELLLDIKNNTSKGFRFFNRDNEKFLTYKDFFNKSMNVLNLMQKKNIKENDNILIATSDPEVVLLLIWACILGNIIPVPCSVKYSLDYLDFLNELDIILENPNVAMNDRFHKYLCNISNKYKIDSKLLREKYISDEEVLSQSTNDNQCIYETIDQQYSNNRLILFSSGTTGGLKGIKFSDINIITNIITVSDTIKFSNKDSLLSWLPLNHILGLSLHLIATLNQVDQYWTPTSYFLEKPSMWLDNISRYKISVSASPNFGYDLSIKNISQLSNIDLRCLRLLILGAEPTSLKLVNKFTTSFQDYGLNKNVLSSGYGLTEAQMVTIVPPNQGLEYLLIDQNKINIGDKVEVLTKNTFNGLTCTAQGYPYRCFSVTIRDEEGIELPLGTIGIIHLSSKCLATTMLTSAGEKSVLNYNNELNTLDVGFILDNQLYVIGRKKDMVIINGENLFLSDIDSYLSNEPYMYGIESTSISMLKNDKEEIVILVENNSKTTDPKEQIKKIIKTSINKKFGVNIYDVCFIDQISKTQTGKVVRSKNTDIYLNNKLGEGEP